jgi:putative transposase
LLGYDYRQAGTYFITICTHGHDPVLGNIVADTMHPNAYGKIATADRAQLSEQFVSVDLDSYVVMPNHLHGIVILSGTAGDARPSLGCIIGAFKTMSTRHVNEWREMPGTPLWQRNYYEHIIRGENDLARIREYIAANPARWTQDDEYAAPSP